ncbi:uncharacterized protein BO80DRAFT_436480 [Aspergillus ibericus CBS 121593]|uniref:Uncharacterized protein n=1 Tax=Aspergillus ibericus CBS 121593 TaxID=1448316 RepID=A0A395GUJ5_9EURO|nr:hypothetical protein BO80DRAFT_436480 [Aspergillus ibericus CBS 121593]RAK99099.1 hypothetical protein BO80DRAFT_436480 [Aspergillus ibericus CBS 121593]
MPTLVSTLLTLPLLALISIPLALSACITICFSILALALRFSLIYVELCLAIIANYFVIPTAANTSLLNFSASEPTTPAASTTPKRRSIDHGIPGLLPALANNRQGFPFPRTQPQPLPRRTSSSTSSSSTSQENNNHHHTPHRRNTPPRHPAPSALLTLISGDEGRDFEGLGGWRCAPTRYQGHLSGTASPSPNNTTDEGDERAWLSINRRLELPFQPLSLRSNSNIEPLETLPWRHRQMASSSTSPPGNGGNGNHNPCTRHHHRSATTSLVSTSLSPKSPLPDSHGLDPLRRTTSPSQQQQQHQPQQNTLPCTPSPVEKFPSAPPIMPQGSSPPDAGAGYFAFRPDSTGSTSGSTTPVEERRSPRPSGRFLVHYPTGVRYRRRTKIKILNMSIPACRGVLL